MLAVKTFHVRSDRVPTGHTRLAVSQLSASSCNIHPASYDAGGSRFAVILFAMTSAYWSDRNDWDMEDLAGRGYTAAITLRFEQFARMVSLDFSHTSWSYGDRQQAAVWSSIYTGQLHLEHLRNKKEFGLHELISNHWKAMFLRFIDRQFSVKLLLASVSSTPTLGFTVIIIIIYMYLLTWVSKWLVY